MGLPGTYKRAVFKAKGEPLILEEVELVPPGKGEVLVKVEACGVCYSDTIAQFDAMGGGLPLVPGHEIIGVVAAVGEGVTAWKAGDRVGGGWHGGHDGTCVACKRGLNQMCDAKAVNGITKDGGYAEYCRLRSEAVVRIPPHVDAAKCAPILCAGVTVFNSMRRLNVGPGEIVAVQGLGGLGHLAIQYARKFGWRVVAVSRGSSKEAFAKELGAHEYIDSSKVDPGEALKNLGGASLIVTTTPVAAAITPLMKGLGLLGKLLVLSVPGDLTINTGAMLGYGQSVHTWPSGQALDSEEAIAFTELEKINCMVETFPLAKANEAYNAMVKGTVRFRAVITME
ncbi:Polyketide synthase, enoylreductase domain [Pleurostoma richardsiae]|uniref:Polyketide synthase, enoylreductase domain n=1 Tax=Pleurostoma richardsiae TaxID=41990 RepID=A0AA38SBA7_9PEZI|nr:Polyketide synthase, enoylreductase domain [Pleurostoma richardsiae]